MGMSGVGFEKYKKNMDDLNEMVKRNPEIIKDVNKLLEDFGNKVKLDEFLQDHADINE